MFVPSTPASRLAKILRKHEAENNQVRSSCIKIVEKAGKSLKIFLSTNNPWDVVRCGDTECFPCSTAVGPMKISCRTPGVV